MATTSSSPAPFLGHLGRRLHRYVVRLGQPNLGPFTFYGAFRSSFIRC